MQVKESVLDLVDLRLVTYFPVACHCLLQSVAVFVFQSFKSTCFRITGQMNVVE